MAAGVASRTVHNRPRDIGPPSSLTDP